MLKNTTIAIQKVSKKNNASCLLSTGITKTTRFNKIINTTTKRSLNTSNNIINYHKTPVDELKDDHTSIRNGNYGNFYHEKLTIEKAKDLQTKPVWETLVFGKTFTDHMLEIDWTSDKGWTEPKIVPYHDLSIAPSCSSLHYAIQCFEGLKAYKNGDNVYFFRPELNANRLNRSSARLGLPNFNGEEFLKCLAELVKIEKDWVPDKKGYSLYIRPTVISTERTLGVLPPNSAKLFVICCPVGPYFKSGFAPVKLLADPQFVRAFPGGTGNSKIGANYGPTILPQIAASQKGYNQVLWLFGADHQITEVGTMNIFFYRKSPKTGEKELITAPLADIILPGVTRQSVIEITRDEWKQNVSEQVYTMKEFIDDVESGRMIEAFGAGTACVVSPVSSIHYLGKDYSIPVPAKEESLAIKLWDKLMAIQFGEENHKYSHNIEDIISGKAVFYQ
ncbi:hypothetical protein ABK040_010280 [Willaertia magna]